MIESEPVQSATIAESVMSISPPKDFRSFVNFFKGYMGVMPLVVAAFAPVVTLCDAIPTYALQTKALSTMSGLLGFLLVAWAFSSRHALAVQFFYDDASEKLPHGGSARRRFSLFRSAFGAPLLLIGLMIGFFFAYSWLLEHSIMVSQVDKLRRDGEIPDNMQDLETAAIMALTPTNKIPLRSDILKETNYRVPFGTELVALYCGIFLCAELAFVFMALREYMQSVLKISDERVILGLTGAKS